MNNPDSHADDLPMKPHSTLPRRRLAVILLILLVLAVTTGVWVLSSTAATTSTIMGTSAPDHLVHNSDVNGVEVGTRFTARADGAARAMRFWKVQDAVGPHTGTLWTAQGERLASVTFTNETATGWQTAAFGDEVALQAGQTYVVSYYAAGGDYAMTENYTGKSRSPDLEIAPGFGVFTYGSATRFPTENYLDSSYWVDVVFARGSRPGQKAPEQKAPDRKAPDQTAPPQGTLVEGFPSAETTGLPPGTALSDYTGPCRITTPDTIVDAKRVDCWPLQIEARGVVITRSLITGSVSAEEVGIGSFTITDSEVHVGDSEGTAIGAARFTATRVHVTGGNRSVNCFLDCTIVDSYVHGQFRDDTGRAHESGIRMGSNAVIRGNTIACDAPNVPPDAGCSAALTGYGDFAAVRNNVIDANLFIGGSGGYCAYGGSTAGKPYSSGTRDIRFTNNVWQRGESGNCGFWGPITSFDSDAPGNVWRNNRWEDGTPVAAAN